MLARIDGKLEPVTVWTCPCIRFAMQIHVDVGRGNSLAGRRVYRKYEQTKNVAGKRVQNYRARRCVPLRPEFSPHAFGIRQKTGWQVFWSLVVAILGLAVLAFLI